MTHTLYKKSWAIIIILSIILAQSTFASSESVIQTGASVVWIKYTPTGNTKMCNAINVEQDFNTLTSKVTCSVWKDVSSVKIDCWNWEAQVFRAINWKATHTCIYNDANIEYKAQCLTSTKSEAAVEDVTNSNFKCNQRYTFNEEIEEQRKIAERNSRIWFENYVTTKESEKKYNDKSNSQNKYTWQNTQTIESIKNDYMDYILDTNRLEYLKSLQYKTGSNFVTEYPKFLPKTWAPKAISFNKNITPTYVQKLLPENIGYYAEEYNDDIDFWKQWVIEEDRNRNLYIVVPTKGMVIPINKPTKDSDYYNSMKSGEEIDINEYLKDWASIYAWTETDTFGSIWNPLVYGHSSYFANKEWNYKTHFQTIINLPKWEEIWVFEKNQQNNEFKRYRYTINESYETEKDDFSILEEKEGRNMTLITCTPIWWTTKRWVLKTTYVDEELEDLKRKIHWSNFKQKYWDVIQTVQRELTKLPTEQKREQIVKLYSTITRAQSQRNYWEITDFLKYFKTKLVNEYYFDYMDK